MTDCFPKNPCLILNTLVFLDFPQQSDLQKYGVSSQSLPLGPPAGSDPWEDQGEVIGKGVADNFSW